ncbi:MAG: hypothetical protein GEV28_39235 [Actinophytocola sp.]|uniref:hypothetical protein n=1 Tax=Actinophytocola sp. TaxID=1872138 RepID=UPI0013294F57|nr:hypothetical protein [Actinophytocola sp.]MPZ86086.1 hypothetical protein [Actinophytocola sp.]
MSRPFFRRHRVTEALLVLVVLVLMIVTYRELAPNPPAGPVRVEVDRARPFAETLAAGWADGAAGIVAPKPVAVGRHSAGEVAQAYAKVRRALVTARLDRAVIVGHDVERLVRLFVPDARAVVRKMLTGDPAKAYGYATRIAEGYPLLPAEPKVTGRMWVAQNPDGTLLVRTNYLFAYAFDHDVDHDVGDDTGTGPRSPMDVVAVDRFEADYLVTDERWPASGRGLWPNLVRGYGFSVGCAAYAAGTLAPAFSERVLAVRRGRAEPERYLDPDAPLAKIGNCPT